MDTQRVKVANLPDFHVPLPAFVNELTAPQKSIAPRLEKMKFFRGGGRCFFGGLLIHSPRTKFFPQILPRIALLNLGQSLRVAFIDQMPAGIPAFGAKVNDPVGGFDDL